MVDEFSVPDIEVCANANLRKAMRSVSQAYDAALKPSGLRATQFTLLAILARRGPMPLTELAEIVVIERTTLTRNLKPLERDGLVVSRQTDDQRVRALAITPKGKRVLEKAIPLWQAAQNDLRRRLGRAQWTDLLGALSATVSASSA